MLKKIIWLVFLLPLNLVAVEVDGLYRAEIEVTDQGQDERTRAIVAGFKQVVVKVTGSRSAASNQSVISMAAGAGRYVQQYNYKLKSVGEIADAPVEKTFIQMTFDKLAVNQMLRDAGLPVWGSQRPQTLAWVGIESNGSRRLLSPETDQQIVSMLKSEVYNRGISIMMPLMDLEDQAALNASDLWGAFEEPVQRASERYSPDLVATIRLTISSSGRVSSNWSLIGANDNRRWEHNGKQLAAVTRDGVNDIADALAVRYAPVGGSESEMISMQVENVKSFADLARVRQLLDKSETVDQYELRSAKNDKVIFAMKLRGGVQSFSQAMAITGVLQEAQPSIFADSNNASNNGLKTSAGSQPLVSQANQATQVNQVSQAANNLENDIQLFYRLP